MSGDSENWSSTNSGCRFPLPGRKAQVLHRGNVLADPLGPLLDQGGRGQVIGPVLKAPRRSAAVRPGWRGSIQASAGSLAQNSVTNPRRMADAESTDHCPGRSTALQGIHLTTQDDLPRPDGDEPYVLFVNQADYGNARDRFAGLQLPAHQRALGPARPQEVLGPAVQAVGQAPCRCRRAG
jgi:hypothetical protein